MPANIPGLHDVNALRLKSFRDAARAGSLGPMKIRWAFAGAFLACTVSAVTIAGCKGAEVPPPVQAPKSPSERALFLLAEDARALGRLRLQALRASLSPERLDEVGERILSKQFRLPVDVSRDVDDVYFAAYSYDKPDAVGLLQGHFRDVALRQALSEEAAKANGTVRAAPSVNGEVFYRVGQGDLYVLSDELLVVGSRFGMERFLRRFTTAGQLTAFPLTMGAEGVAVFRAAGPRTPEELPAMLRQQPMALGLREASGTVDARANDLVATLVAVFADDETAKRAHAFAVPFAKLIPTWTRGAMPAAAVSVAGSTVTISETIEVGKLEAVAGTAAALVPR